MGSRLSGAKLRRTTASCSTRAPNDRAAAGLHVVLDLLARDQRHRSDVAAKIGVTYAALTPADLEGLHCAARSLSSMVTASVDVLRETIAREHRTAH